MAQYYWEPLENDVGGQPSNLTYSEPWDQFEDGISVQGTSQVNWGDDIPHLRMGTDGTNDRRVMSVDAIEGDTIGEQDDVEVWMRFAPVGTDGGSRLCGRVDVNSHGSETGYTGGLRRSIETVFQTYYLNGSATTLDEDSSAAQGQGIYQTRFRLNGDQVQTKIWLDSDPEPSTWTLSSTDSTISAAGAFGYFQFASSSSWDTEIYALSVATNGDEAPTSAGYHGIETNQGTVTDIETDQGPVSQIHVNHDDGNGEQLVWKR